MNASRLAALVSAGLLGAAVMATGAAAALVNPLADAARGAPAASPTRAPPGCPDVPPIAGLSGIYYYTDKAATAIDHDKQQADRDATRPLNNFGSQTAVQAERYLASHGTDRAAARCGMAIMDRWARANALTGTFNGMGLNHRRWTINGVAVDFLAIENAPGVDPAARARVAAWLGQQGRAIIAAFPPNILNNHLYWTAAAVSATAIAGDDRASFGWAIEAVRRGLAQIDRNGALPQELGRGNLAMHYQVFALEPLVQVAGFAKANGIDLYTANDGALGRLVALVLRNLDDQSGIAALAGTPQTFREDRKDVLSWAEQYFSDTGDCAVGRVLARSRPVGKAYLGGNTTLIHGRASLGRCG
jgi:poly(beta-D-mannuronate) lyase